MFARVKKLDTSARHAFECVRRLKRALMSRGSAPLRDAAPQSELAAPLMARGLHAVVIGDAQLPRDVTAAVADATRLLEPNALSFRSPS